MKKYVRSGSIFGEPEGFFTREDCMEFIETPLEDAIADQFGIGVTTRCYIEDGNRLDVDIQTKDGYEFNIKLDKPIDMRKIRRPADLQKYVPELLQKFASNYDGNVEANFYYQLMNKLDKWALSGTFPGIEAKKELDNLLSKIGGTIEDVADANDCYNADDNLCSTWDEMVSALHILFEQGKRVET